MNLEKHFRIYGFCVDFFLNFQSNFTTLSENSGDPDQMLHDAASDLVLHCLPMSNKNPFR